MNKYNPNKTGNHEGYPNRRSIRLKGYDYSQAGLYFVTICVKNRECLFGDISDGKMILNDAGKMIETEWLKLPQRFKNIELHEYTIMPNHFHAILQIVGATLVVAQNEMDAQNEMEIQNETVAQNDTDTSNKTVAQNNNHPKGQPQGIAPTKTTIKKTLGDMVGAFESITTVEYIRGVKQNGWQLFDGKLWQRNYHEHIIRNEQSYQNISQYIIDNPLKWNEDKFNPDKKGKE